MPTHKDNPQAHQQQTTSKSSKKSYKQQSPENTKQSQTSQFASFDQQANFIQSEPEVAFLTWEAASRPFKKRDREFYTTVGVITFLLSLILFFAGQFLLIGVIISVAFLAYVLASVPPEKQQNSITNYGIRMETKLYYWAELGRFWFETKFKQPVLHIETGRFPGEITLMLGNQNEQEIKQLLSNFLIYERPTPTWFDQTSTWLQKKIPLSS